MAPNPRVESIVLRLMTPLEQCVVVRPGKIDVTSLELLERHHFDNAPVSGVAGVIPTSYLRTLFSSDRPLSADDPVIDRTVLDSAAGMREMLETVAEHNAVLVSKSGALAGILTLSDFNKHPLRSLLYASLANLEVDLAEAIAQICPDPWD